jgi:hypothetical protein
MRRKTLPVLVAAILLSGCAYHRDVSHDPCYGGYAEKQLKTAKPLRLYGAGFDLVAAGGRFDLTSVDHGKSYLVGIVPAGTSISNQRILEFHDIGISWKEIWGDVTYKGKVYPFRHHLGTHAYPESWKRMFELFQPN